MLVPPGLPGSNSRPPEVSWRFVAAIIAAFAFASPFAVELRQGCSFPAFDGQFWGELYSYHSHFTTPLALSAVDPLQGMFDAYPSAYFGYAWIAVSNLLTGSSQLSIPLAITFFAVLLCVSTLCLALSLGLSRGAALLSALTSTLVTYSYFTCYGIDGIFALSPQTGSAIASAFFILSIFQVAGKTPSKWLWLPSVGIVFFVVSMVIQAALDISIVLPGIGFFGLVLLITNKGRAEFFKKLTVAAATSVLLFALGIPHYFLSVTTSIDTTFFYDQLVQFSLNHYPSLAEFWNDYLLIVLRVNPHTDNIQWISVKSAFVVLGYLIALVNLFTHKNRAVRAFSIGLILYVHIIFVMYFVAHYSNGLLGSKYNIPNPYHFLYVQYCISLILATAFLQTALSHLRAFAPGPNFFMSSSEKFMTSLAVIVLGIGLALPFYAALADQSSDASTPWLWLTQKLSPYSHSAMKDMRSNDIVDVLQDRIGMQSDMSFRGTVATFTFATPELAKFVTGGEATNFQTLWAADRSLQAHIGNEMRHVGLWRFLVPTFYQTSATRTAQFTYMTTAFLMRPSDIQTRGWLVLTQPNKKLLALWGVRFIITDTPFNDWIEVKRISVPPNPANPQFAPHTLYLYQNDYPNLANYSPTEIVHIEKAEDVALRLADASFDPRATVLVSSPIHSFPGSLSPVIRSHCPTSACVRQIGLLD